MGEVATVPYVLTSLERVRRIELPSSAWEAAALPLSYTRIQAITVLNYLSHGLVSVNKNYALALHHGRRG